MSEQIIVVVHDGEVTVVRSPKGSEVVILDLDYDGDLHQVRLRKEPASRWLCAGCLAALHTSIVEHLERSDDPDLICEECGQAAA